MLSFWFSYRARQFFKTYNIGEALVKPLCLNRDKLPLCFFESWLNPKRVAVFCCTGWNAFLYTQETLACPLLFLFLSVKSCVFWTFCFHLRGLYKKGKGNEEEVFNWLQQNNGHYSGYSALRNLVVWTVYRVMFIEIYEINQFMRHTVSVWKISTWKCQRATGIRQPYTVTTSMTKNSNPTMSPHIGMHQSNSLTSFEKIPVQKSGTIHSRKNVGLGEW